jgi:hypothetical protein
MCTKRHPARVKALQIENARAYGNGIYFALEGKTRVWRSSFALMRLPGDISLQVRSFLCAGVIESVLGRFGIWLTLALPQLHGLKLTFRSLESLRMSYSCLSVTP